MSSPCTNKIAQESQIALGSATMIALGSATMIAFPQMDKLMASDSG
jgi:hypothetical protein